MSDYMAEIFVSRLNDVGFNVSVIDYTQKLSTEEKQRYGFNHNKDKLEDIYICTKRK